MNTTQDYIDLEKKWGAHNYDPIPVVLDRGKGVWLWDVEENLYMDFLSGYSALNQGHSHPRIVKALQEQASKLSLTSRAFHNSQMPELLKMIAHLCNKEAVIPMNSGAEAVETAIKIARKWGYEKKKVIRGKAEIIVFSNNFHGRTTTIVGFSSQKQYRDRFGPFPAGFKLVEYGNIKAFEKAITPHTVAVLIEPIQGEGGIIIPPAGFLSHVRGICSSNNILFMADEIQTGLGRTGRMFACDYEGVVPDVYILGKALSGGMYPVSAVVANWKIMDVLNPGDHGSTFGGNPLACAVAKAAIEVLVEDGLVKNARKMGKYFMKRLEGLNSPQIEEVRGVGLLLGLKIKSTSPDAREFCLKLKDEGILCNDTHGNIIRLAPPLIIDAGQIDWAMKRIEKVFKRFE